MRLLVLLLTVSLSAPCTCVGETLSLPTQSLDTWRSWNGFAVWRAAGAMELDTRVESRIISAESFKDSGGSVTVRLRRPTARWSRVELWFRCTSDLRSGYVVVLEPARGRLRIEELRDGRAGQLAAGETGAEMAQVRLGYRVEGSRIAASPNGRDLVAATDPDLICAGHLALGCAFTSAAFSNLTADRTGHAGLHVDTFESLQGWDIRGTQSPID